MTAVALALAVAVGAAAGGWALLRRRFVAVTVEGLSMRPTLEPGDRVLVRRAGLGAVRPGHVVVLGASGADLMIKRVAAVPGDPVPDLGVTGVAGSDDRTVPPGRLVVLGDNPAFSLDSRRLGYLPGERLLGVVVRRLSPGSPQDFGARAPGARAAGGTTRAGTGPRVDGEGTTQW
ncbi:S26 family signal peptidase [Dactylosporangium sp. McL0621]|uniref:S26 family signal peptidase n=1 Tax=Dactylosporangium sp. McL0621 TaxID=3415678 RepID=UPI003CEAB83D